MANKMFLFLDGIPGGSGAKGRKGWLDITSVDWGVEQAVAISGTGSGMTGAGSKQRRLLFTSASGVASPLLFEACVTGKHITEGTFEVVREKSVVVRWRYVSSRASINDGRAHQSLRRSPRDFGPPPPEAQP